MENKLQELTRKLYDEGLSKGKQEAEQLLADAGVRSEKIIADARKEAAAILRKAEQSAEDLKKNTMTEFSLAARQTLGALKQQVERLIVMKSVSPSVGKVNADPAFIREMLLTVAGNWNGASGERIDLKALLPADRQAEFREILHETAAANLTEGLEIAFDNKVKSGFRIGPKTGGYYISFTDADFGSLLDEYLRPQVSELLFGGTEKKEEKK